ncbi:hypothetical protein N0V90_000980 [Kalmusia sp. IMI 367209]|nr:hypothetical protein N0V90_000980 [Kalmusia sp. IMI 367209]
MVLEIDCPPHLVCFHKGKNPRSRGRFDSAKFLVKAGIWVGYAAPEKHSSSYKGLPSFSQLKSNTKTITPPFPPTASGTASGDERWGVCRACYGETSTLIQLHEIQLMKGKSFNLKVTIMKIDSRSRDELFCILIPKAIDRSLRGIETFRPYEIAPNGQGTSFTSEIELITPRNRSQVWTYQEVLESFGLAPAPLDPLPTPSSSLPEASTEGSPPSSSLHEESVERAPPSPTLPEESIEKPLPERAMTKTLLRSRRQRSAWGRFIDATTNRARDSLQQKQGDDTPKKRTLSDSVSTDSQHKRQNTKTPVSRPHPPTPISREVSRIASETPGYNNNDDLTHFLSEDQAKRVLLVWVVEVDGVEYDFSHSLHVCPAFSDYLDLVCSDAVDDPQITNLVNASNVWRLTYELPGHTKKAFTIRINGNDSAYGRIRQSLAQSSFWQNHLYEDINIDLRIVS